MAPAKRDEAMRMAKAANDREAIRRIERWRPGGRLPHHKYFDRAKRQARSLGHSLGRFRRGEDEGSPDPWSYYAACALCGHAVLVVYEATDSGLGGWVVQSHDLKNNIRCRGPK